MENVEEFNKELLSINNIKPPISKAKISSITKLALKATHYYKYVVQSVEKFIWKCKPIYKLPGLYVIDAIIHQARLQFKYKDVYAPRFSRNLYRTFNYVFQCPDEDRKKVLRVLNLWSLNEIFKDDILKPIFELNDKIEKKKQEEENEESEDNNIDCRSGRDDNDKDNSDDDDNDHYGNNKYEENLIRKPLMKDNIDDNDDLEDIGNTNKNLLKQLSNLTSTLQNENINELIGNLSKNNETTMSTTTTTSSTATSLTKGIEFLLSNPNLIKQLGELQNKFVNNNQSLNNLEDIVEIGRTTEKDESVKSSTLINKKTDESNNKNASLLAEENEFEKFLRENEQISKFNTNVGKSTYNTDIDLRTIHLPNNNERQSRFSDRNNDGIEFSEKNISGSSHSGLHDAHTKNISKQFNLDDINLPSNIGEIHLPNVPLPPLPNSAPPLPNSAPLPSTSMDLTADLPMNLPRGNLGSNLPPTTSGVGPIHFNIQQQINLSNTRNPLSEFLPNFNVPPPLSKPIWMSEPPPPLPPMEVSNIDMEISQEDGEIINQSNRSKSRSRSPNSRRRKRKSSRHRSRSRSKDRKSGDRGKRSRKDRSHSRDRRRNSSRDRKSRRSRSNNRYRKRSNSRDRDRNKRNRKYSRDRSNRRSESPMKSSVFDSRDSRRSRDSSARSDRKSRDLSRSRDISRSRDNNSRNRSQSIDQSSKLMDRNETEMILDEKEIERKNKGYPPPRKDHITICTKTLWVGHLPKTITEEELRTMFNEYGTINTLNVIPPRGCAFVNMAERINAVNALKGLKNTKLGGKYIVVDWAPGKYCKDGEYKKFWDVGYGATYLPYNEIENTNFESLIEGCVFDFETVPEFLRSRLEMVQMSYEAQHCNPMGQFNGPPGGFFGPPPGCFPPFPPMMPPPGIRLPPPGPGVGIGMPPNGPPQLGPNGQPIGPPPFIPPNMLTMNGPPPQGPNNFMPFPPHTSGPPPPLHSSGPPPLHSSGPPPLHSSGPPPPTNNLPSSNISSQFDGGSNKPFTTSLYDDEDVEVNLGGNDNYNNYNMDKRSDSDVDSNEE